MRVDDATQEKELVAGDQERQLVAGEQRDKQQKRSWRGRTERQLRVAAGDHGGQWRLDKREANREVGVDPRRGSQHQTPEQRGEETR